MTSATNVDRSLKESVVDGCYATWGAGGFQKPGWEAQMSTYFTKECEFSYHSGLKQAKECWSNAKGYAGMHEMVGRWGPKDSGAVIDLEGFKRLFAREIDGVVYVKNTWNSVHNASGRRHEGTVVYQEWHINEAGKVTGVKQTFQDPAALDALFVGRSAREAVVDGCYGSWAQGGFQKPGYSLEMAKFFTEDCQFTYPSGLREASACWSAAKGYAGMHEMVSHWGPKESGAMVDLEGFNRVFANEIDGVVYVKNVWNSIHNASGRRHNNTTAYQEIHFGADNRISHIKMTFQDPNALDALFVGGDRTPSEQVVDGLHEAWKRGEFHMPGYEAVMAKYYTEDVSFTFTDLGAASVCWSSSKGFAGMHEMVKHWGPKESGAMVDMENFTMVFTKEIDGVVYCKVTFNALRHANGKRADNSEIYQEWHFNAAGKVNRVVITAQNGSALDALFE